MTPLLEQLMEIADKLGLPFEVGLYTATPLSLIHISEPTRLHKVSRMPSSA